MELERPVARDLKGGESHSYRVALNADQLMSAVVEQRGVDVTMTLVAPDGVKQADVNDARGTSGIETLTVIAAAAGDYQLEVRTADKNADGGQYEVKIVDVRAPTAAERTLEEARRLTEASRGLRQKGKYDEALPPAERSLAIREKLLGAGTSSGS